MSRHAEQASAEVIAALRSRIDQVEAERDEAWKALNFSKQQVSDLAGWVENLKAAPREAIAAGVEAAGCICEDLRDERSEAVYCRTNPTNEWSATALVCHDQRCPVALAVRIRSGEIGGPG